MKPSRTRARATVGPSLAEAFPLRRRNPQRGSLILLVMCLLAVLGIALASYLAVSNQAMKASNRSAQTMVSAQLAEMGLEEALRAFNNNSWSTWTANGTTATWSTSGTTASCTLSFTSPVSRFGQNIKTAAISIRVDNYNANQLNATWSSSAIYRINDQIGYNGIWYSCVKNHSNQAPTANNFTYWVPTYVPWKWSTRAYKTEEMVNYNGTWYRCINPNTNQPPPNTNWQSIPTVYFSPSIDYTNEAILNWYSTWYRRDSSYPGGWDPSPAVSWRYRTGSPYSFDDLVYYNYIWYRYINATPTANIAPGLNAAYWEDAQSGGVHGWSSGINYNLGDVVYYSSTAKWYRCTLAHASSASLTPSNATYWSSSPLFSIQWKSGPYYGANDLVTYNGVWYLCISSHTSSSSILPTNTSYWIGANTTNTSYLWNSSTSYSAGNYRCYGGVWYKCLSGGANKSPNNSSYWTASWKQSWQPNSTDAAGAPVIYAESRATLPDGTSMIKTQLRATIAPASLFPNAAAASSSLTITSGTGTVDSYDSVTDPTASTPGYSAVLAAGSTLTINGTTAVSGYLAWPSPPAGISTDTTVYGASSPVSPKVDPAQVSRSPYIPQFDCRPSPSLASAFSSSNFPQGTLISDPGTTGNTLNLGTSGATTPSRYYYDAYLRVGSSYPYSTIYINGPVILYINGSLRTYPDGTININSTGSAEIHVDGGIRSDAITTGSGYNNLTQDPKKLVLISDISSTATHWQAAATTSKPFYGVIYTPKTTATLGLQIQYGAPIYGAISAKNIDFTAAANVHYDTSLRYAVIPGVDQPYAIAEWRELTDPADRAVLP